MFGFSRVMCPIFLCLLYFNNIGTEEHGFPYVLGAVDVGNSQCGVLFDADAKRRRSFVAVCKPGEIGLVQIDPDGKLLPRYKGCDFLQFLFGVLSVVVDPGARQNRENFLYARGVGTGKLNVYAVLLYKGLLLSLV